MNIRVEDTILPEDDPKVRRPDISRANDVLNWEPQITLKEGLKKTIPFFKEKLGMTSH